MKKIAYIGITMTPAGTERAFLNTVSKTDFSQNDVTLFLAKKEGELLSEIPPQVHIREVPGGEALFSLRRETAVPILLKSFLPRHPFKALGVIAFLPSLLIGKKKKQAAQRLWAYTMRATLPKVTERFDSVIAFWGDNAMFYAADKTEAAEKIAWLHFEYDYPERDDSLYGRYFARFDKICVVSERTRRILTKRFPQIAGRFVTVANEIDEELILKKANEPADPIAWKEGVRLLSVGRVNPVKGLDLIPPVLKRLKEEGIPFSWTVVGGCDDDSYKRALLGELQQYGLTERTRFCGAVSNPYPYMKECDVFLQCSRSESFALAPREALVFGKPVICTRFEAAEYLKGENDKVILCDGSEESLFAALRSVIQDIVLF